MSEENERSDAMLGSLPAALADYKQLAKDCGVDEGIDLPVVAMAFVHGAAYGAKQPTLTDEELEAIERAAFWMARVAESRGDIHSAWYLVSDAATLRGISSRLG